MTDTPIGSGGSTSCVTESLLSFTISEIVSHSDWLIYELRIIDVENEAKWNNKTTQLKNQMYRSPYKKYMYEQECFLFILLKGFYIDSDSLALSRPIRMKDMAS